MHTHTCSACKAHTTHHRALHIYIESVPPHVQYSTRLSHHTTSTRCCTPHACIRAHMHTPPLPGQVAGVWPLCSLHKGTAACFHLILPLCKVDLVPVSCPYLCPRWSCPSATCTGVFLPTIAYICFPLYSWQPHLQLALVFFFLCQLVHLATNKLCMNIGTHYNLHCGGVYITLLWHLQLALN